MISPIFVLFPNVSRQISSSVSTKYKEKVSRGSSVIKLGRNRNTSLIHRNQLLPLTLGSGVVIPNCPAVTNLYASQLEEVFESPL